MRNRILDRLARAPFGWLVALAGPLLATLLCGLALCGVAWLAGWAAEAVRLILRG